MSVFSYRGQRAGTRWYYKIQHQRAVYRGTCEGATTRQQALAFVKNFLKSLRDDAIPQRTRRAPRLADFIRDQYLPWSEKAKASAYDDKLICQSISKFFGARRLNEITRDEIEAFQEQRRLTRTRRFEERSNSTVNRELSVLSRIFSLAVERKLIKISPCARMPRLPNAPHRIVFWTEEEEQRVMPYLSAEREHLRALVVVALNTGMRRGEMFKLKVEQLDFNLNTIHLTKTKTTHRTGRGRVIPMNSVTREELLALARGKSPESAVFTSPRTGKQLVDVKKGFAAACRKANVKNIGLHGLRHTFATRCVQSGISVEKLKVLLGHTSIDMTMRYVHLSGAGMHSDLERLVAKNENSQHAVQNSTNFSETEFMRAAK